jgi:hypothetical protein
MPVGLSAFHSPRQLFANAAASPALQSVAVAPYCRFATPLPPHAVDGGRSDPGPLLPLCAARDGRTVGRFAFGDLLQDPALCLDADRNECE